MSEHQRPQLREIISNEVGSAVTDMVKRLLTDKVTASCLSCVHFKEHQGELCLMYKQRPPARIIALGCPDYMDNLEVPF